MEGKRLTGAAKLIIWFILF